MRRGTTLNDLMAWDNTLFDGITLNDKINHGTLVSAIMFQCGLQPVLYQDYDVFKSQVHWWFAAHKWNFDRLVKLIELEYNPLWNKDGVITHTETREYEGTENETFDGDVANTGTVKHDTDGTESHSGTDTETITYNSTLSTNGSLNGNESTNEQTDGTRNTTNIHSVMGFNATSWQDTDKDTFDETSSETKTGSKTNEETTNGTETKTGTDQTQKQYGENIKNIETLTETHNTNASTDTNRDRQERNLTTIKTKDVEQGNIGVTTSQAMFKEEVELLGGFNLYQWIARKFDNDLMMGVYI